MLGVFKKEYKHNYLLLFVIFGGIGCKPPQKISPQSKEEVQKEEEKMKREILSESEKEDEENEESSILEFFEEETSDSFSLTQTEKGSNPFVKMKFKLPSRALSFRDNEEASKNVALLTYGFYDVSGKSCLSGVVKSKPETDLHHYVYAESDEVIPPSLFLSTDDYRMRGEWGISSCYPKALKGTEDYYAVYEKDIQSILKWSVQKNMDLWSVPHNTWNYFFTDFSIVSHWAYDAPVVKSYRVQHYSTLGVSFDAPNPCKNFNKEKEPLGNQCGYTMKVKGSSKTPPFTAACEENMEDFLKTDVNLKENFKSYGKGKSLASLNSIQGSYSSDTSSSNIKGLKNKAALEYFENIFKSNKQNMEEIRVKLVKKDKETDEYIKEIFYASEQELPEVRNKIFENFTQLLQDYKNRDPASVMLADFGEDAFRGMVYDLCVDGSKQRVVFMNANKNSRKQGPYQFTFFHEATHRVLKTEDHYYCNKTKSGCSFFYKLLNKKTRESLEGSTREELFEKYGEKNSMKEKEMEIYKTSEFHLKNADSWVMFFRLASNKKGEKW